MRWSSFFKCWVLSQHFHSPSHIKRLFSSCSFQFSCSITFNSLWPYGLQHTRLPCPSPTQSFLKFMSMELVMPSNHLILCLPLLLLPSIFPSIRVFSNESALHIRWPKYWSFSFSISSSNEYSGLISFRIDWFDLLGVPGTLKGLSIYKYTCICVYIYICIHTVEYDWPTKKNEIMPFSVARMDLEIVILSEVGQR